MIEWHVQILYHELYELYVSGLKSSFETLGEVPIHQLFIVCLDETSFEIGQVVCVTVVYHRFTHADESNEFLLVVKLKVFGFGPIEWIR